MLNRSCGGPALLRSGEMTDQNRRYLTNFLEEISLFRLDEDGPIHLFEMGFNAVHDLEAASLESA
jgi:hypothetical protein